MWLDYSTVSLGRKKLKGKMLIVEIKAGPYRDEEKEKAVKEVES